ncbi:MAG: thioredoxin family protein [Thiobacillaceae bacterium]
MSTCITPPLGAPLITLTLVGTGEPLLRLEKRLSCAAAGLGLALNLTIRKDAEALGIPFAQTPAVLADGQVVLTGLPRTEEIEDWLRRHSPHGKRA